MPVGIAGHDDIRHLTVGDPAPAALRPLTVHLRADELRARSGLRVDLEHVLANRAQESDVQGLASDVRAAVSHLLRALAKAILPRIVRVLHPRHEELAGQVRRRFDAGLAHDLHPHFQRRDARAGIGHQVLGVRVHRRQQPGRRTAGE